LRPKAQFEALQQARQQQTTDAFKTCYRARGGIKGCLSQGVRACNLRRSRYLGLAQTRLQHVLTAVALNLKRIAAWLCRRTISSYPHRAFSRKFAGCMIGAPSIRQQST
jgi:transposase